MNAIRNSDLRKGMLIFDKHDGRMTLIIDIEDHPNSAYIKLSWITFGRTNCNYEHGTFGKNHWFASDAERIACES